jgi:hypothetical protein
VSALGLRVEALRRDFAAVFDGPGLGLIESLLARAERLGGDAGARLSARASLRVEALEAALARATLEVTRELDALGDAAPAAAREALARGDRQAARRAIRRARAGLARAREQVGVAWAARLAGEATSRGEDGLGRELTALCGEGVIDRDAHAHAVALGSTLSSSLFRRSAESARATVAIARSADNLPESAGRYNSQVLALRALSEMAELSPGYVRVVVAAIDDLAAVETLLGPSPSGAKAARARRVRKGGSV